MGVRVTATPEARERIIRNLIAGGYIEDKACKSEHVSIALRDRAGAVVAEVIVDAADVELVGGQTWRLMRSGGRNGYAQFRAAGRTVLMHRVLLGLDGMSESYADHIDGNGLNNCRGNLRVVTAAENRQNLPSRPASSSRFRGVWFDRRSGKWRAEARLNGIKHALGSFATEEEAARAASAWRIEHMPFTNEMRAVNVEKPGAAESSSMTPAPGRVATAKAV